jgi:hypothetical protein
VSGGTGLLPTSRSEGLETVNPVYYHWTPNRPQRVYDDPDLVWAEWLEGKYLDNTGYTNYKKNWTRHRNGYPMCGTIGVYTYQVDRSGWIEVLSRENDRWQTKRH